MNNLEYESYKYNILNNNIGNYINIITHDKTTHHVLIDNVLLNDNITNYNRYYNKPILLYKELFNNNYFSFSILISDIICIHL